jgi:hypothetical protein
MILLECHESPTQTKYMMLNTINNVLLMLL